VSELLYFLPGFGQVNKKWQIPDSGYSLGLLQGASAAGIRRVTEKRRTDELRARISAGVDKILGHPEIVRRLRHAGSGKSITPLGHHRSQTSFGQGLASPVSQK